jgi:uncharacterized membrane protein YccC
MKSAFAQFARFSGMSRDRTRFAVCAAAAAWFAVVIATALHLPNAHWAGITVFTVSQPSRGLLVARCFSRLAGSFIGAIAGALILLCFGGHSMLLIVALGIWLSVLRLQHICHDGRMDGRRYRCWNGVY